MSILLVAAEIESFIAGVGVLNADTNTANMDTAFVRSAVRVSGPIYSSYFRLVDGFVTAPDLWIHFDEAATVSAGNYSFALEANGATVLRLMSPDGNTIQLQGYKNGVWEGIGPPASYTLTRDDRHTIDLHVRAQTDGICELFVNGVLMIVQSGDFNYLAGINNIRFYLAYNGTYSGSYSQVIVADEKTIGWKLAVNAPSGAGSNGEWSGSYTDVNETGINNATIITGQAADAISTFARAARTIPAGLKVKELVVAAHARLGDGAGVQNVKPVVRVGSVNYVGDNFNLTTGFKTHLGRFAVNPATGQAWTNADAGAAATQFGVKAVA